MMGPRMKNLSKTPLNTFHSDEKEDDIQNKVYLQSGDGQKVEFGSILGSTDKKYTYYSRFEKWSEDTSDSASESASGPDAPQSEEGAN